MARYTQWNWQLRNSGVYSILVFEKKSWKKNKLKLWPHPLHEEYIYIYKYTTPPTSRKDSTNGCEEARYRIFFLCAELSEKPTQVLYSTCPGPQNYWRGYQFMVIRRVGETGLFFFFLYVKTSRTRFRDTLWVFRAPIEGLIRCDTQPAPPTAEQWTQLL